jgi:hypothetical protein
MSRHLLHVDNRLAKHAHSLHPTPVPMMEGFQAARLPPSGRSIWRSTSSPQRALGCVSAKGSTN